MYARILSITLLGLNSEGYIIIVDQEAIMPRSRDARSCVSFDIILETQGRPTRNTEVSAPSSNTLNGHLVVFQTTSFSRVSTFFKYRVQSRRSAVKITMKFY